MCSTDITNTVYIFHQYPINLSRVIILITNFLPNHKSELDAPTTAPIFETVLALAKGIERLAHENTLSSTENRILQKANEALSKRLRAERYNHVMVK